MCRLAMNIATFSHLLKKVDFDAVVDHLAITHIMRSKAEPATTRIKRLLELLSPYSFNLYYIKGKDMVFSDFLSRQKTDDSNPHELIPILFMFRSQVDNHSYRINSGTDQPKTDKYLVQTRSQAKSSGIKILEIHGANKGLDHMLSQENKDHYHHYLLIMLTKDCLHILFPSPELVKVELD